MADRMQWVFLNPCGCAFGVMEHGGGTQAEAWREFYDAGTPRRTENAIGRAVVAGKTMRLVPHAAYVAEYLPQLRAGCPHQGDTG